MTVEERKQKRRSDCYTFKELYEFFSQFYGISTKSDRQIGDIRDWNLHKSDIEFRLKSFNDEDLVTEFVAVTWSGGWSHRKKCLQLEYSSYDFNDKESWYIRDNSTYQATKINSSDFLTLIVDFIIENEETEHYQLPLVLKRQLILNKLLDN